ncbi:MAG: ABC transporter permease [Bacteroidota bacterium]
MLRSYLKIAYRNLLKNKLFSLINILGLAIGLIACLLIIHYVGFELSYDTFHLNSDRVYRVALEKYQPTGESISLATNFNALPKAIKEYVPEAEVASMSHRSIGIWIFTRQQGGETVQFQEDHLLHADEHFLDIFTFDWLAGDPSQALTAPYSLVLTKSMAAKYFGQDAEAEDIIGQSLRVSFFSHDIDHTITGIIKDVPNNTHLSFNALLSSSSFEALYPEENFEENWQWYDTFVYIRSQPSVGTDQLTTQLQSLLEVNSEAIGEGTKAKSKIILQPLTDIHLHSHLQQEAEVNGNYQRVVFLIIIAFALIIVASLNYVNMHTAQSLRRMREVGIRKYVGAGKYQLSIQVLVETGLILSISLLLTFTAIQLLLPQLQAWLGFTSQQFTPYTLSLSLLGVSVVLVLIGSFPTYFMAGFEPIKAIQGKYTGKKGFHRVQRGLVGFQLFIALLAIMFTFVLHRQYQFMRDQFLGFDDQVLVFSAPTVQVERGSDAYAQQVKTFKSALLQSSNILQVTASTHVPGVPVEYSISRIYAEGQDVSEAIDMNFIGIDSDYIETFGLEILAGENFLPERPPGEDPYILNESATRALGFTNFEEAIGQYVLHHNKKHKIQAVVNDYHQKSLREPITPLAFINRPAHHEYFAVKIAANNTTKAVEYLSGSLNEYFPGNPFTYYFLDDAFEQLYKADRQYSLFFNILSLLIVLIACLGLFSVATFSAQQRTKEVGIRKVLGAPVQSIVALLSWNFVKLVLITSGLALPIAYWVAQQWLAHYAYRIEISGWLLLLPVGIILLIALLTISFQTIRTALANPTDSLRYE